ncbi:MAG: lysophospholipase L1-like esterase [Flammeovirgaceae bacterium]|jgi:lysophospholipase L1-like esterase
MLKIFRIPDINLKYYLGGLLIAPLLPLMYWQGKQIRKNIPQLPEATGNAGFVNSEFENTLNILFIGESTIAGVGAEKHEDGFSGTLAKELAKFIQKNIRWKVYAKSGYTALDVREKLIPQITETETDLIVVGLGGNDAFGLNSPEVWSKHVQSLIWRIRMKFPDAPIAFLNMPPIKDFPAFTPLIKFAIGNLADILGENLDKVIENEPNAFYNSEAIILEHWLKKLNINESVDCFFSDGVHPAKFTYQAWAKDFVAFLMKENVVA